MHEIGHNLGLAHSGGLNGATYTDHTGYMGNPCYGDDNCEICFNAAKNWQLPWYNDRKMLIDPRNGPQTVRMVGIADYGNNSEELPVVLKIETGSSTDQFIAFNRATGVNKDNDEADDEVTIVETGNNGEGYSQSYLKAHLIQGETYTYDNWAGTGSPLRVTATEINLSANPAVATINIELVTGPTAAPTACSGKYIEVDITTDNYPSEISWTITNTCTGSAVLSGGPYSSANAAQDTESVCVEDGSAYDFAISDSYGDGICCSYGSGSYTVKYGGSVVASGGDYGSGETKSFGSCGGPGPTPSTASPTKSPTASPTKSPTASPTKSPTASPTKSPTKAPTQAPVASPTPPTGGCPTGQSLVEVDIKLDNYPGETTWSVTNCAGQSVRSGGPYSYSAANTDVSDSVCVPDGTGYKFKIDDSYGDGVCCGYGNGSFSVKYAGSQVASGGAFGSSFSTDFGDACPTGCPAGTKKFKLDLVTDYYPSETSWNLKTCNGQTQLSGTRYGIEQCIPDTSYTFTINDSWGDGICCSYGVGSYTVEYDNAVLKEGGDFGFSEQVLINGGCANIGVPNPVNVCSAYKKKGLCKRADEACVWKGNANNGRCVKGVKETPKKI
jgi:hypothetical protein